MDELSFFRAYSQNLVQKIVLALANVVLSKNISLIYIADQTLELDIYAVITCFCYVLMISLDHNKKNPSVSRFGEN